MDKQGYKLVLDIGEAGELRIDIRKLPTGKKTIGHVVLSKTGLTWIAPKGKKAYDEEVPWGDFAMNMTSIRKNK